ncbi:P-loop containing nucleoside triphosphate hydrolase protein [Obelidium mucronatum]|nr:P-loop containing nucleoside triphosphate hydrolase protein [Obelidium mucronatum]
MTSLISSDTLDLIKKFLSAETASICVDAVSRLEESIRAAEPEREHLVALKEKISAATSDELPITEYIREISKHLDQNLVLSDVINRSEGFAFVLESLATALTRKDLESQDLMDLDRLLRVEVGILTSGLPIYSKRKSLSRFAQDDTKACLVLSSTGSGKSTCIPHFLAHDRLFVGEESTTKKILVAQPRRNATTSLATRLAGTLGTAIGTEIGSHIGKSKSKISKHQTMIHCVTYGILLSYAQNDPHFRNYSIIVLDEVHEDSCELHFCIGLIKHAQKHNPTLKVLLMSAQVNAAKFTDFFGQCPVIEVAGQSFPVSEQHVGSLSTDAARFIPGAIEAVMNIHKRSDNHGNPDILVFLPRVNDIVSACSQLRQKMADEIQNGGSLLDCALPLHSFQLHSNVDEAEKQFIIKRLPMASRVLDDTAAEDVINSEEGDELDGLFGYNEDDDEEDYDEDDDEEDENADLDEGNDDELNVAEDHVVKERRVIFCTNIAETSLTFQKVGYVVDAGLQLTISRNPILNTQKLELKPTTTVSAVQRKGRAGRLAPGHCVRLYSPADEENFVDQTFSGSDAMDMMILRIISLVGGDLTSGGFEWFVPPTKEEFEYVLRSLRGQRMISLVEDDNYRLCQAGHCALEFCRMGLSVTATRFLLNIWTRRTPNLESAAMNQAAVVGALLSLDCGNRMFQKGFKVSILFGDSKPTTTTAAAAGGGGGGSTYCKLLVYDKWLSLPSKSKRAKWCKEHFVDNSVMKELHELHSRILKKQKSFIPNHFNQNGSDWNHFGLKSGSMDDAVLENLIAARFQYIGRVSSEGGGIVFWIGDKEMAGVVGRDEFAQFGHNKEAVGWVLINCVFHKDRYYVSHLDPISNEHLKRAHQILHTEFRESFALGNCEKWCVGHDLFQCKEALPESEFRLVNAPKVIKKTSGKQDKENQSVGCTIS